MEYENKNHIKRDLLLAALVLLIASAGLLFNYIQKQKTPPAAAQNTEHGQAPVPDNIIIHSNDNQPQADMKSYVEISIDGKIVEKLDLDKNTEMTIPGYDNGTNHLIIEDGQVWINDASCPDKICIHQGKISRNSEIIVCLPNLMIAQVRINE